MTDAEYYAALRERYKQVDWNNLQSVRAYNDFARLLRSEYENEKED